jgi:hypothetical protein
VGQPNFFAPRAKPTAFVFARRVVQSLQLRLQKPPSVENANAVLHTIKYVVQRESGQRAVTLVLRADLLPALSHTTFPNIVGQAS